MIGQPIAIRRVGLLSSIGLSAPAACAAIRAKVSNASETRFLDSSGEWITAHVVPLPSPDRGLERLARMAVLAIDEVLVDVPEEHRSRMPLLLCVAEKDRPGRTPGIDDELLEAVQRELGIRFDERSSTVAHGRAGVAVALGRAKSWINDQGLPYVLVAATDSLVTWPTLNHYEFESRLVTATNSDGFMPGEGAGSLLLGKPLGTDELIVGGLGFAVEKAHIRSEEPLRADGLTAAIKAALAEAGIQMGDVDCRIADLSGEQYYFKEAALALSRTFRARKDLDLWHPAECTGEPGAMAGISLLAVAEAACRNGYLGGKTILAHWSADGGARAATTLHWQAA